MQNSKTPQLKVVSVGSADLTSLSEIEEDVFLSTILDKIIEIAKKGDSKNDEDSSN